MHFTLRMKKIYALFLVIVSLNIFAQSISLQTPSGKVYPDEMYFCPGESFDFQVNASASSTGSYGITSVTDFNLPAPTAFIPFSNKVGYDHFSNVIHLPFELDFYGQKYTKVVVGGNGRLLFGSGTDFDNLHLARYVDKVHSGNDASSTNKPLPDKAYLQIDSNDQNRELNFAQIFFGFTDIGYYNTAHYNKLTYGNATYNGVNGILFNFNTVLERTVSGGYSSTLTSQVLLLEDNRILIKVNKTSANSNAIIGFQDSTGENAIWPPNNKPSVYNNGKWTSNASTSWSFAPNQNLTPQFKWTVNGTPRQESGNSLTGFTPSDGDVLKVEVTYHDETEVQVGAAVTDQIIFKQIQPVQISAPVYGTGCAAPATLSIINPNPDLIYEWYNAETGAVIATNTTSVNVTSGSYYAKAKSTTGLFCGLSNTEKVTITTSVVTANTPDRNNPDLIQCASSTQTYDLPTLFNNEVNPSASVTITYHNSLSDAQNGTGAISNPAAFRSGMGYTTLFIRVVDNITGCVATNFPSVTLYVHPRPNILVSNPITITHCPGNTVFDLTQNVSSLTDAAAPVTVTAEYYSQNGTLLTPAQIAAYDAAEMGTNPYIRLIYNSTCDAQINFELRYHALPVAFEDEKLICGETSFSLSDFKNLVIPNPSNYTFTDENGNALPTNFTWTSLPFEVKYFMTDNTTGCKSLLQTFTFVAGNPTSVLTNEVSTEACDAQGDLFDGKTTFNLDSLKATFNSNANFEYFKDATLTQPITSSYQNETPFNQTVYARVSEAGFCPVVVEINLTVNTPSKSTTLQDVYYICYGDTLTLDAGSENVSWKWSSGGVSQTETFATAGNYTVELTNADGCSYTHTFVISDENQPKITAVNQSNTSIEVIAEGGQTPYTYYFNGVAQSSNILLNPTDSSYEIQVQSATGCFGPPVTVYFIKVKNTFTPNGDGVNDYWTIENLDSMEEIEIIVSDRNGRSVFRSNNKNNITWDGKTGGRELPTDTYWYVVKWFDPVTQKSEVRQGWVLLKNRN